MGHKQPGLGQARITIDQFHPDPSLGLCKCITRELQQRRIIQDRNLTRDCVPAPPHISGLTYCATTPVLPIGFRISMLMILNRLNVICRQNSKNITVFPNFLKNYLILIPMCCANFSFSSQLSGPLLSLDGFHLLEAVYFQGERDRQTDGETERTGQLSSMADWLGNI